MICICQDYSLWALFLIRVSLGITFVLHGSQKVFGFFGGAGLNGFAQWILTLGFSAWLGYVVSFIELISGILLVFGVASELAALSIIPIMLVAIWKVHLQHGFFIQNNGYEYALHLIIAALAIIIAGPGKLNLYSLSVCKLFFLK